MKYQVLPLTSTHFCEYDDFVNKVDGGLLYYTRKYRKFLHQVLNCVESEYFLAFNDEKLEAILPIFVQQGIWGPVVNSLPYYGSHGGILASKSCSPLSIAGLQKRFSLFCQEINAVASTIIENPYANPVIRDYQWKSDFSDIRTGQVTYLPSNEPHQELDESLMVIFHSKTRNMVRKGCKAGFDIQVENSELAFYKLYQLHDENMSKIGGKAKDFTTFKTIYDIFTSGSDYNLYVAYRNREVAAALLVLYSGKVVEYFTPVIAQKFRSEQPLSALIFRAMKDAVATGFKIWNWGGTWLTQENVYRFKSRWGAIDKKYSYHTKVYKNHADIIAKQKHEILEMYPDFYVVPFYELQI